MTISRRTFQQKRKRRHGRDLELALLLVCSLAVAAGLALVYRGRMGALGDLKDVLVLSPRAAERQIADKLEGAGNAEDRRFAAHRLAQALEQRRSLPNVGALARITVGERELTRGMEDYPERMAEARQRRDAREERRQAERSWLGRLWDTLHAPAPPPLTVPLLSGAELAAVKPSFAVRTPADFRFSLLLWSAVFFLAFYVVHACWRWRSFAGDRVILPLLHLLAGLGLILMVSLRDPVRDTLLVKDFAVGAIIGCAALVALSFVDYERQAGRFAYVWLLAGVVLALGLAFFGSGPGASDARVNLLGFQPVEVVRVLLVLFLAGYFGATWDALRDLRQQHGPGARLARLLHIGRFDYALPAFAGVALSLALFFLLKDMGPALVVGCMFLALYSIARGSFRLALAGLALLLAGFAVGHLLGVPRTVADRVDMWRSVWDNSVHGGDQVAHALWSLATGGLSGTGLGLGNPELVPAGHTDLIVAILGEQLGWLGIAGLFALYGLLCWRGLRAALNAAGPFTTFLAAGLTVVTALQLLLISAGILGIVPLTGVVSPFLSYGRSSMVVNFALFGIILAISSRPGKERAAHFAGPLKALALGGAAAMIAIVGWAAYYQDLRSDATLVRGALVVNADGVRRYEYNPRLVEIAREIPRGNISDRTGLPLATSDFAQLEAHREQYTALGVSLAATTSKTDRRHYPLGPPLFYLLGDVRSGLKQGARNTDFEERASRMRLQGYDDAVEVEAAREPGSRRAVHRLKYDYTELVPLLRHRYQPEDAAVRAVLRRVRDVRMTIDARLQMKAAQILERSLLRLHKKKGAVVVLEPSTGDLLAAVSYPWPAPSQISPGSSVTDAAAPDESDLLDRARFGLYPPGSAFKIVTAVAALRLDPALAAVRFPCVRLEDGRVGNLVKGFNRPVRDDVMDKQPHGDVDLVRGITYSCNAYFAQLGAYRVRAANLLDTARLFGIAAAAPNTAEKLREALPFASYGQGQVVVTPFQMARVAATIANGGRMPFGRWVLDEDNRRNRPPEAVLAAEPAALIGRAMRAVVTTGTGRAAKSSVAIAGKTGTAELARQPSHAWFIGFAPYGAPAIAFAVLVENGQYGGTAAAPIAAEIVAAARQLGMLKE